MNSRYLNFFRYVFQGDQGHLTKSTLISLFFHVVAVGVLFWSPFHLHRHLLTSIKKGSSILEKAHLQRISKNQVLKEAFSSFESVSLLPFLAEGLQEKRIPFIQQPPIFSTRMLSLLHFALPAVLELPDVVLGKGVETPLSKTDLVMTTASITQAPLLNTFLQVGDPSNYSAYPIVLPSLKKRPPLINHPPSQQSLVHHFLTAALPRPPLQKVDHSALNIEVNFCDPSDLLQPLPAPFLQGSLSVRDPPSITKTHQFTSLAEYALPSLQEQDWSDFFDVDVKLFAGEEGKHLFSINLIPQQTLTAHQMKQNYIFILDRSNSIEKHRYQAFKRAALRAIGTLRKGDFFNILLLDQSITRFRDTPIPFTPSNQRRAEEFLDQQPHGHYRGGADIYTTLTELVPVVDREHAYTAILVSDGDSPKKIKHQRKKINRWLETNQDRIVLYAATAGSQHNLSSLRLISFAARGSLLYSDTYAAFPRKLAKLVIDLRHPIAKEMTVSIIAPNNSTIQISPPSSRLPYILSDRPFALLGTSDKLTDFTLVLEGKNHNQYLTIRKKISLSKAKPGSKLLLSKWRDEQTHHLLDQYLRKGDLAVLEQAEERFDANR